MNVIIISELEFRKKKEYIKTCIMKQNIIFFFKYLD